MITISIDDNLIKSLKNDTILQASLRSNIEIPHLCNGVCNDSKEISCQLCMVYVKKKGEEDFTLLSACKTKIEHDMIIISDKSDEIKKHRKYLLLSIMHTHNASCKFCDINDICRLKKYLDQYDVDYESINITTPLENEEKINKLPSMLKANYDRCIHCDLCKRSDKVSIKNYKTMMADICSTYVFTSDYFNKNYNYNETISTNKSYCIFCSVLCECKYLFGRKEIFTIESMTDKKYGICDKGREIAHITKFPLLDSILKNGYTESLKSAKRLYKEFFLIFKENEACASLSAFYPIEDMDEAKNECLRLNIKITGYRKPKLATETIVQNENIGNYHAIDIIGNDKIDVFENFKIINKDLKLFFIISDYLLESEHWFIEFCEKYSGKYIIFTPYNSLPAHNAYLAFPIANFGEFEGTYIDKHKNKRTISKILTLSKNRMTIKNLIKYLYL